MCTNENNKQFETEKLDAQIHSENVSFQAKMNLVSLKSLKPDLLNFLDEIFKTSMVLVGDSELLQFFFLNQHNPVQTSF